MKRIPDRKNAISEPFRHISVRYTVIMIIAAPLMIIIISLVPIVMDECGFTGFTLEY